MKLISQLACGALIVLHVTALFSNFVAPYPPEAQHRDFAWAPPAQVRIEDFHLVAYQPDANGKPIRHVLHWVHPTASGLRLFAAEGEGLIFLLGTDGLGRDQLSRLIHGSRVSLFTGLTAALLASITGAFLGTIAGFYGGRVDTLIMRLADLFMALPWMYLLLGARAFFPLNTNATLLVVAVVGLLGLVGWARPARLVRSITLEAKELHYVLSSLGFGAGHLYILRHHIWPEIVPTLTTYLSLAVPQYVLAETTLSFLGLGPGGGAASWGDLVAAASRLDVIDNYWWMLLPLPVLAAVFACYNTVATALSRVWSQ